MAKLECFNKTVSLVRRPLHQVDGALWSNMTADVYGTCESVFDFEFHVERNIQSVSNLLSVELFWGVYDGK